VTRTLESAPDGLGRGALFAGRYEVIEALGAGGMGEVYRVEDTTVGQEIALKLIRPEIAAAEDTIGRFRRELTTARMVAHRNVCRMFDLGEFRGRFFITMEYVDGEDLRSFLRRSTQLTAGTALRIAGQVCEGLAEAHRLGVVHRDLKPSNIMIDQEGNARIMDFGIARSLHSPSITGTGLVVGTPDYMSPEQAAGEEADPRSDIYSLGIILYEMVTGRVPFSGNSPLSLALKHKLEVPRNPQELVPQLPDELGLLILKCLEKDKEKRYQSAAELNRELEKIESGATVVRTSLSQPASQGAAGASGTTARAKKTRRAVLLVIFAVVLSSAALTRRLWLKGKGEPLDSIAVLPFENVNADPEIEYLSDGITETLINRLSRLSTIKKVISRASAFTYKGERIDPHRVGAELGVKAVLTARMVRYGETISISPALVRTSDNSQLWGERYKRKIRDLFAMEDEITSAIVAALRLELSGDQKKRISERRIDNVQAYELYLKAKQEIRLWTRDGCDRALQDLEKGLELAGENAMLNAGIGYVYYSYANMGVLAEENGKKAERYANKALDMDPESSDAHLVLGLVYSSFFGNPQGGVYHLKKALESNARDGDILWWLCMAYAYTGKISAAERAAEKMAEFDPLNPQTVPAKINVYHYGGRLDLAFELLSKDPPPDPPGLLDYAWFLVSRKRLKEAEDIVESHIQDPERNLWWQLYALLKFAARGDREGFSRLLNPDLLYTVKRDPQYSTFLADYYALLGEREKALDWLENAVDRGFINYPYLNTYDPYLADLRGEARFRELMEKVRLEWERFDE